MPKILQFLTREGYVNTGFLNDMPRPFPFSSTTGTNGRGKKVIIVGAGPAGLAAAYHLRNFGYDVRSSVVMIVVTHVRVVCNLLGTIIHK